MEYKKLNHSFTASAPLFRIVHTPCLAKLLPTNFYPLHLPYIIPMPSLTLSCTVSWNFLFQWKFFLTYTRLWQRNMYLCC